MENKENPINVDPKINKLTENGVVGIHGDLILGSVSDETLRVGEGNIAWRGAVALVVCDDLHFSMLENSDTRVSGT